MRFDLVPRKAVEHDESREGRPVRSFGDVNHPEDILAVIFEYCRFLHYL
jgi:hypothetical protein